MPHQNLLDPKNFMWSREIFSVLEILWSVALAVWEITELLKTQQLLCPSKLIFTSFIFYAGLWSLICVTIDLNIVSPFICFLWNFNQFYLKKNNLETAVDLAAVSTFFFFLHLKSCHEVTYQAFVAEFFLCGFLILVQVQLCFHSPDNFIFPPWEPSVFIKLSLMTNFSAMLW